MDDEVNEEITEFVLATGRKAEEWHPDWEARFNIKPTEDIPVLIDSARTGRAGGTVSARDVPP